MPLPGNQTAWPPTELASIGRSLSEWSAWYEGTPEALTSVYQRYQQTGVSPDRRTSGGLKGALQRMWWGRPTPLGQDRPDQSHIPIAADLARASADLLYAEPPTFKSDHQGNQDRLDIMLEDLHSTLANGAELGAILGGRFQRVTWDKQLADKPFLTTVDADAAIPEFRWGRLTAVTFWHVVASDSHTVWRHLERHELTSDGIGIILHGLYEGTADNLGRARPLNEHPATAGLATLVDQDGAIIEGRTRGLCVAYIPNQSPQRRWRTHPVGRNLGRSDLDGIEPLMDNLDEAYSSWMRDIRLGKNRIIVPSWMLRDNGPGLGASFDTDQEIFTPLNVPDAETGAAQILAHQFNIRVDEHERTCDAIVAKIIHAAGYSAQTFGLEGDVAMTATEVEAKERRSFLTRDRKIRNERAGLTPLMAKLLTIDQDVFGTKGLDPSARVSIKFGDSIQDSMLTLANTADALFRAKAASTRTRVALMHPDWDETEIDAEAHAILGEDATVTDPYALGS